MSRSCSDKAEYFDFTLMLSDINKTVNVSIKVEEYQVPEIGISEGKPVCICSMLEEGISYDETIVADNPLAAARQFLEDRYIDYTLE